MQKPSSQIETIADLADPFVQSAHSRSNSRQIAIFALLTVLLTAISVYAIRYFYYRPVELTFVVDKMDSFQGRFAQKLAKLTTETIHTLHIRIVASGDDAATISGFSGSTGDLIIARSDALPQKHARAIAILDHQVLLLLGAKSRGTKFADLKNARLLTSDTTGTAEKFLRKTLARANIDAGNLTVSPTNAADQPGKLLGSAGYTAFLTFDMMSKVEVEPIIQDIARRSGGAAVIELDDAKTLEKRVPGWFEETIEANSLSAGQSLPSEDASTIGVQWLLIARSKLSNATISELTARIIENKTELSLEDEFADHIEAANTEKDAILAVHGGALEYYNDDTKTFLERYSDLAYLSATVAGIIGSLFTALYTFVTAKQPLRLADAAPSVLELTKQAQKATSLDEIDAIEQKFQELLHKTVNGLSSGTIEAEGIHAFNISSANLRDILLRKRASLTGAPQI